MDRLVRGLTITLEDNGDMLLTGPVIDQTALQGLLKTVRNFGKDAAERDDARRTRRGRCTTGQAVNSTVSINGGGLR